jgi:tellurite resistance protein
MLPYEIAQARQQEMHRRAAQERLVSRLLRDRREARRLKRAAAAAARADNTSSTDERDAGRGTKWSAGNFHRAA